MKLNRLLDLTIHPPKKTALVIDADLTTYEELNTLADLYARTLRSLGLDTGDRAAFFMNNCKELAALYLACFRTGIVAVPLSFYNKPEEIVYQLNHCQSRVLLAESEMFAQVADMARRVPSLVNVFLVGGGLQEHPASWERATRGARSSLSDYRPHADDPAVILYTSGSTARPKGVTHSRFSLRHSTINRCQALEHTSDDSYFITSYLCHGSALTSVFLTMCAVGGTMALTRCWSEKHSLEILRRLKPSVAAFAPSQLQRILDHPETRQEDFASLRYLHVGGDAIPESLFVQCQTKTGRDLGVALGMTECGGYLLSPLHGLRKPGALGKPIPGTTVRLINENGDVVEDEEVGQIIVRTKALMQGYWDDPVNTAQAIRDGWLYTGDLAVRDNDGFYRFVGRCKHMIIRDQGNVSPLEVEDIMEKHPKVKKCAVAGVSDGEHGQAILAFIIPSADNEKPTEHELTEHAEIYLAERKIPRRWIFVDDIPLTSLSKIDRNRLNAMAGQIAPLSN